MDRVDRLDRVHGFKLPKSVVCPCLRPLPALSHTALSLLVRARSVEGWRRRATAP
ncbi:hypothetical protein SHJG_6466 [Streptomyces hygroscopicus subsp. jinggangensis 5008]|nr:hypothetical protein SHJG_6466 [Streptomyces hygroscopicus subsp. jinggangensis 5008]